MIHGSRRRSASGRQARHARSAAEFAPVRAIWASRSASAAPTTCAVPCLTQIASAQRMAGSASFEDAPAPRAAASASTTGSWAMGLLEAWSFRSRSGRRIDSRVARHPQIIVRSTPNDTTARARPTPEVRFGTDLGRE